MQLFAEHSDSVEVSQPSGSTQGTAAKKRRLMSGWSKLLDAVSSAVNTPQIIPWSLVSFLSLFVYKRNVCIAFVASVGVRCRDSGRQCVL